MSGLVFVGLDVETTGSGHQYRPCQVGVAARAGGELLSFSSDIGWAAGSYLVEAEALGVNGFSPSRIEAGRRAPTVDREIWNWVHRNIGSYEYAGMGLVAERRLVPVGFNVGGYDLPFVRDWLPQFYGFLSRRVVDLNAVCFALGGEGKRDEWKRRLEKAAREAMPDANSHGRGPHDAGYDAVEALLAFEEARRHIRWEP